MSALESLDQGEADKDRTSGCSSQLCPADGPPITLALC